MSSKPKGDPALVAIYGEELLADEASRRVDAMSDAEIDADLRAKGFNLDSIPTPEQILAGARHSRDERAHRAHRALGAALRAPPAPVVSLRAHPAPPSRRLLWLAAAAFVLFAGTAAFTERRAIVALFQKPAPIEIHKDDVPPPETPEVVAGHLLDDATKACDTQFYGICARKVDEAVKLLPAGEDDPRVKALREASRLIVHTGTLDDKKRHPDGGR